MDWKEINENELTSPILKALWQAKRGNWQAAHEIAQSKEGDPDYDRIHAYLHREEGDRFNAGWWYKRIGLKYPIISLSEEWQQLWEHYS